MIMTFFSCSVFVLFFRLLVLLLVLFWLYVPITLVYDTVHCMVVPLSKIRRDDVVWLTHLFIMWERPEEEFEIEGKFCRLGSAILYFRFRWTEVSTIIT